MTDIDIKPYDFELNMTWNKYESEEEVISHIQTIIDYLYKTIDNLSYEYRPRIKLEINKKSKTLLEDEKCYLNEEYVKLEESSVQNLRLLLNCISEKCNEATVRVLGDGSLVKGVELDLGPEWVLWLHTGCNIKK